MSPELASILKASVAALLAILMGIVGYWGKSMSQGISGHESRLVRVETAITAIPGMDTKLDRIERKLDRRSP